MSLTLNNGVEMPALGFGVFQTPPEATADAVHTALRTGYRLIDTAAAYGNEREVGEAIRRSGLARDEVFIETKVWISDYGYDQTLHAFDKSAGKLGTDQIDLLILHQALPSRVRPHPGGLSRPGDPARRRAGAGHRREQLHARAPRRPAGARPRLSPRSTRWRCHPYFTQPAVQAADAAHGILTQAWSPIGGITSYRGTGTSTFDDPAIAAIAAAHGKTPAQIMIRWHLQEGRSAIPKSVRPERIAENFDVFDFELTTEELKALDTLDTGVRGGPEPDDDHPGELRQAHPRGLSTLAATARGRVCDLSVRCAIVGVASEPCRPRRSGSGRPKPLAAATTSPLQPGQGPGQPLPGDQACLERGLQVNRTHIRTPDLLGPAWPWPAFATGSIVRYPFGMPRADRVSLTAANLAMPPVDHLSNKGTLNVLLDRTMSGLPAGLPPDRTMVGLFMNFSRLTDKALREYDAARAELLLYVSPPDEILAPVPTRGPSTTWRTASAPPTARC